DRGVPLRLPRLARSDAVPRAAGAQREARRVAVMAARVREQPLARAHVGLAREEVVHPGARRLLVGEGAREVLLPRPQHRRGEPRLDLLARERAIANPLARLGITLLRLLGAALADGDVPGDDGAVRSGGRAVLFVCERRAEGERTARP